MNGKSEEKAVYSILNLVYVLGLFEGSLILLNTLRSSKRPIKNQGHLSDDIYSIHVA